MNKVLETQEKYDLIRKQSSDLEEEYRGKKKGDVYNKRRMTLLSKARGLLGKLKKLGTQYDVANVKGKVLKLPPSKDSRIRIVQEFEITFTGVSEQEAYHLTMIRLPTAYDIQIKMVIPGNIKSS